MDKSSAQKIVKVFAILNWIGAAMLFFMALASFAGGAIIAFAEWFGEANYGMGGVLAVFGLILLVLAVVAGVLGVGLLRLRNWARILIICRSIFGALAMFFLLAILFQVKIIGGGYSNLVFIPVAIPVSILIQLLGGFKVFIPVFILILVIGGLEIYLFAFNSDVKSLFTTRVAVAKKK